MFLNSRKMWARISRALVVVLLAVLLAGGFVYLQSGRTPSSAAAASGEKAKPVVASAAVGATTPGTPSAAADSGKAVALPPLAPAGGKPAPTPGTANTPTAANAPGAGESANVGSPIAPPKIAPAAPMPAAEVEKMLADAKAKLDGGELVAVRNLLNDAIVGDRLTPAAAEQARAMQARANEKLVFSPQPFPGDTYTDVTRVEQGKGLAAIARQHGVPWEMLCRINGVSDKRIRLGKQLKAPLGPVHVMVSKSAFRMDLFLGGLPGEPGALYLTSLPVGLGKDNSTPTGTWQVEGGGKMKNPTWTNPRSGEHFDGYDKKNPLGGYWIPLKGADGEAASKTGYGIHGTIEPDSIGKQASMGCIRLKVEDVQIVYDMLNDKSRVLVRD